VLRLEGYEYDLTADCLTARVVRVGVPGQAAERTNIQVPVGYGLQRLIHGTLTLLGHALATRSGAEPIDRVELDWPDPRVV
jgi:hypothetical protein